MLTPPNVPPKQIPPSKRAGISACSPSMMGKEELSALISRLDAAIVVCGILSAFFVMGGAAAGFLNLRSNQKLRKLQAGEALVQQAIIDRARAEASSANLKATEAERDIASARLETADAMKAAAEANARAAEANETAERERLARVKLEEQIAPRQLLAEQAERLREALVPFAAGATRVAFLCSSDPEPARIGKPMSEAIKAAGWIVTIAFGNNSSRAVSSIYVEVSEGADAATRSAAVAFVSAVRSITNFLVIGPRPLEKILVSGSFTGTSTPPVSTMAEIGARLDEATIRITIGPK